MRYLLLLICVSLSAAENGLDGWLRYAPLPKGDRPRYGLPSDIVVLNSTKSSPVNTAGVELQKGIKGILASDLKINGKPGKTSKSIVVGTVDQYIKAFGKLGKLPDLESDGFWLNTKGDTIQILGQNERGALYGAFEYLSRLAQGNFDRVAFVSNPSAPIRWVNQWDNLDGRGSDHGSVERGYGGPSLCKSTFVCSWKNRTLLIILSLS